MDRNPSVSSGDQRALSGLTRAALQTILHPFEFGKTLIQLGYEPIRPWPVRGLTGKQHMMLPNIFQYVGHMAEKEGNWGLYRGLKLRIAEVAVSHIAFHVATDSVFPDEADNTKPEDFDEEDLPDEIRREHYLKQFLKDVTGRTAAVVISHPLHVCAVRSMAQFVGGEVKYIGIWRSMRELYRENGICGFFSGLVPRLLAEVLQLAIWHSLTFAVTTYIIRDKETRTLISTGMGFIASSITYPFLVVSKCMCVSGSGLVAGQPPNMPVYSSWIDCWSQLRSTDQLWRGSSILLWRYDTRPQTILLRQ